MKLYRAEEMRQADRSAAAAGVPTQLLMEAAGRAVAESLTRHFPACRRPLVLCGKGNNGGDGYVAARYLSMEGLTATVLELSVEPSGDAAVARDACRAHVDTAPLEVETLERALDRCDLVIDALLGSGLQRPLTGELQRVVELLNGSERPILSVDVPSGVSADHPRPPGPHVRATRTVQLAAPKLSSAFDPARSAYGEQEIAAIGIPPVVLESSATTRLLCGEHAAQAIPQRARDAHKYEVGTVLVLAGSPRYLGAAELACRGAYRGGAGLVTLGAEERLSSSWPEVVFARLAWDDAPTEQVLTIGQRRSGAVVAGPGLDERALPHLPDLLARVAAPWVLDAGALSPSGTVRAAARRHGGCVLTPHGGEASRLLDTSADEVTADPIGAALLIAREWNAVCVLKGGSTVIAAPGGSVAVSPGGHAGMATGGTGDVLAGLLGAFVAAGGPLCERVEAAVAVHALAGRLAGRRRSIGLVASDVVDAIPVAIRLLAAGTPC